MADFAKKFGLTTDPEYRRYVAMNKVAEKEGKKETLEAEIKLLNKEDIQVRIKKNRKDLENIGNDFKSGDKWNAERESALALFRANNLDPTKPLEGSARYNTALVQAQDQALRTPWTGKSNVVITPPPAGNWSATVVPPPAKK
jgi:hypothetical protein